MPNEEEMHHREEEMRRHHEEHDGPGHHEGPGHPHGEEGEDCGCEGHGPAEMHREDNCGCGGHHRGGMEHGGMPHPGCNCPCHQPGMMGGNPRMDMMGRMGMMSGFGMAGMAGMAPWRHFVSREEIIARLDEYLKQIQMEEEAVQERIETIKKRGESSQA